jgi:hypothetical protein
MQTGLLIGLVIVILIIVAAVYYTMNASSSLPTWAPEGAVVRCPSDGGIYKINNGTKRHFSYETWGAAGYPDALDVDCAALAAVPDGAPM